MEISIGVLLSCEHRRSELRDERGAAERLHELGEDRHAPWTDVANVTLYVDLPRGDIHCNLAKDDSIRLFHDGSCSDRKFLADGRECGTISALLPQCRVCSIVDGNQEGIASSFCSIDLLLQTIAVCDESRCGDLPTADIEARERRQDCSPRNAEEDHEGDAEEEEGYPEGTDDAMETRDSRLEARDWCGRWSGHRYSFYYSGKTLLPPHPVYYPRTTSPPSPWIISSSNSGTCSLPSTRARTLFEVRNYPERIKELEAKSRQPNVWDDQKTANALFAELKSLKKLWGPTESLSADAQSLIDLLQHAEASDVSSLEAEAAALEKKWMELEPQLYLAGEFDHNNAYLSVSGGAGGTEAQDWAAMLLRMYLRYCERQGWKTLLLEKTDGAEAGIKSATVFVEGERAYGYLKCEKGTHRLVRLSPFNAKNLRQTSFALVEVLPEIKDTGEIQIDPGELRIDTYRSGGAGGQHVNKTESAVRITHRPTGIVVSCQSERSQLQNRERAMQMLRSKLLERKRREEQERKAELKGATQSADFGQQIRSYVLHPYQMVKDLRTDHETSNTQGVLDGDLQPFIDAELKRQ